MVKLDSSKDYYAALELSPDATNDEIKKQYRRLALQWHPDRNPDKPDCVARFQDISQAHEILTDQSLRDRYDIDRRRAGNGPSTTTGRAGARGNPYSTTSAYPPPPRRTQAPAWTKPASAPAQTGADRFTSFPRPAPTSRKGSDTTKANLFSAWQQMRGAKQKEQQASKAQAQAQAAQQRAQASFRPVPPRPTVNTTYSATASDDPSRTSSSTRKTPASFGGFQDTASPAWQRRQSASKASSAASGATPSRAGHKPSLDATAEDATGAFGSRAAKSAKKSSAAPMPPPRPQPVDDVPFTEVFRTRTPYPNASGEKTSLSGDGLRRSQSTRDTVLRNVKPGLPTRHHSMSPAKPNVAGTSRDRPFVISTSSESSASEHDSEPENLDEKSGAQDASGFESTVPASAALNNDAKYDSGLGAKERPSMWVSDWSEWRLDADNHRFSMPLDQNTFDLTGEPDASNQPSINTTFSATDWSGTFTGSGSSNAFAAPPQPMHASTRRTRDTLNRKPSRTYVDPQTTQGPRTTIPAVAVNGETRPPFPNMPKSAPLMSSFAPDVWKESAWDFTPSTSRPGSSSNADDQARRAAGSDPTFAASSSKRNSIGDVAPDDAMDVDPAPPPSMSLDSDPRTYTVPLTGRSGIQNDRRRPSRQLNRASAGNSANNSAGNSSVNLQGLSQSLEAEQGHPFDSLRNMANGLPFTSQASPHHPTKSFEPDQKPLPLIPKSPEAPSKLSLATWHAYCTSMSHYLTAFNRFNAAMLSHFQASLEHEAQLAQLGATALEAVGQAGEVGLPSYMALLKGDERFRECWSIAQERHAEAVSAFVGVKEKVKKLKDGPGLSNV